MSRVFWDANIFIYIFEGRGESADRARALRRAMLARGDQLLTSALVMAEILVKPLEAGDEARCAAYERAVAESATILSFELRHARVFARIRRDRAIRGPDAVHLACAALAGVDLFVTADARLQGKPIEGIQFIVPLDRVPL